MSHDARAGIWTNVAGHSIEAKLVGGDAQNVILERPNGMRVTLPLLSLSPEARKVASMELEKIVPGAAKKVKMEQAGSVSAHARALYGAGLISAEELQATLKSIRPVEKKEN